MWIKLLSAPCLALPGLRLILRCRRGSVPAHLWSSTYVAPLGVRVCSWTRALAVRPCQLLRADGGSSGAVSSNFKILPEPLRGLFRTSSRLVQTKSRATATHIGNAQSGGIDGGMRASSDLEEGQAEACHCAPCSCARAGAAPTPIIVLAIVALNYIPNASSAGP